MAFFFYWAVFIILHVKIFSVRGENDENREEKDEKGYFDSDIFSFSLFYSIGCSSSIALEILEKQQEIKNFKVDVELVISTRAGQDSEFFFTYYYEEPDKIYMETDNFVLLPKEALKTMQPSFFQADKYSFNYLGKKEELDILELIFTWIRGKVPFIPGHRFR